MAPPAAERCEVQAMEIAVLVILIAAGLTGVFAFFWKHTKAKGRWGLGAFGTLCPHCGTRLPFIRKPASKEEAMWGGWTCPKCGARLDKYGRERVPG
jgi:hypothetical protein